MSRSGYRVLVSLTLTLWRGLSLIHQTGLATAVLVGCVAAACANDPPVALPPSGDALLDSTAPGAPSLQEVARRPGFPPLTGPVNDFADVIDRASGRAIEALIRDLQRRTGDVLVVVTLPTCAPFTTLRDCSLEIFDNHGNGIGQAGRDNGVLVPPHPDLGRAAPSAAGDYATLSQSGRLALGGAGCRGRTNLLPASFRDHSARPPSPLSANRYEQRQCGNRVRRGDVSTIECLVARHSGGAVVEPSKARTRLPQPGDNRSSV